MTDNSMPLCETGDPDPWGETGFLVIDHLKPIGDYLAERPDQPLGEFIAAAWNEEDIGDRYDLQD